MATPSEMLRDYFSQCPVGSRHSLAQRLADAIGVQREVVRNWYRDQRVANKYHQAVVEWLDEQPPPGRMRAIRDQPPKQLQRKVTPGTWSQYRPYFEGDESWESAMRKADDMQKRGLVNRASRIRLNLDAMRLGEERVRRHA